MSVIRASILYMEDDTHCDDVYILYKPRSDFIITYNFNLLLLNSHFLNTNQSKFLEKKRVINIESVADM